MMFFTMVAALFLINGCATPVPVGVVYTELKLPITATGESGKNLKVGTAECISVLGLVATGDASIQEAMDDGGITKISHIDWEVKNILGILGRYKVVVYGQ
ncbi:MAG: TRL-like family protein [Deltaproteobacteria bacterium]|nr:TRL-like family protein [Deltaproteobacteria bacterium]